MRVSGVPLHPAEATAGTPGATLQYIYRGSHGDTTGHGCRRALSRHLLQEPILPDGGMLYLQVVRVFPIPD